MRLDLTDEPEFDLWQWVDFWYPAAHVVPFKRDVYERALRYLAPLAGAMMPAARLFDPDLDEATAEVG